MIRPAIALNDLRRGQAPDRISARQHIDSSAFSIQVCIRMGNLLLNWHNCYMYGMRVSGMMTFPARIRPSPIRTRPAPTSGRTEPGLCSDGGLWDGRYSVRRFSIGRRTDDGPIDGR